MQGYISNILTTPIMLLLPVVGVIFDVIPGELTFTCACELADCHP